MDALAAELPDGSPRAAFERASALDATDHSDLAVPLYRAALALVELGQERAAASLALTTLAPHLPSYQRAVANYARLLLDPGADPEAGPAS